MSHHEVVVSVVNHFFYFLHQTSSLPSGRNHQSSQYFTDTFVGTVNFTQAPSCVLCACILHAMLWRSQLDSILLCPVSCLSYICIMESCMDTHCGNQKKRELTVKGGRRIIRTPFLIDMGYVRATSMPWYDVIKICTTTYSLSRYYGTIQSHIGIA
jgi:hypothetical protein